MTFWAQSLSCSLLRRGLQLRGDWKETAPNAHQLCMGFLNCLVGRTGSANVSVPLNYPLNTPPFFILMSYPRILQLLSALSASEVFLPTSFTPNKYRYICPLQKPLVPAVFMPAALCMLLWEVQLLLFPSFLKPVVNPSAKERIAVKSWGWRYGLLSKVLLQFDDLSPLQHEHSLMAYLHCSMNTSIQKAVAWRPNTFQSYSETETPVPMPTFAIAGVDWSPTSHLLESVSSAQSALKLCVQTV